MLNKNIPQTKIIENLSNVPTYGIFGQSGSTDLNFSNAMVKLTYKNFSRQYSCSSSPPCDEIIMTKTNNVCTLDTTGLNSTNTGVEYLTMANMNPPQILQANSNLQYTFEFSINKSQIGNLSVPGSVAQNMFLLIMGFVIEIGFISKNSSLNMLIIRNNTIDIYNVNINDIITIVINPSMVYIGVNGNLVTQMNNISCKFKKYYNNSINIQPGFMISATNNLPVIIQNIKYYSTPYISPLSVINTVPVFDLCPPYISSTSSSTTPPDNVIRVQFQAEPRPGASQQNIINAYRQAYATSLGIPESDITITASEEFTSIVPDIIEEMTTYTVTINNSNGTITPTQVSSTIANTPISLADIDVNSIVIYKTDTIHSFFDTIFRYTYPISFLCALLFSFTLLVNVDPTNIYTKSVQILINIFSVITGYIGLCTWFNLKPYPFYPFITNVNTSSQLYRSVNINKTYAIST